MEQPPTVCPFIHFRSYLQETSEDTSLWFDLSPIGTGMRIGWLVLWNCFMDFAVEHQVGCCATEHGFAGDVGSTKIRLIDWLIGTISLVCRGQNHISHLNPCLNHLILFLYLEARLSSKLAIWHEIMRYFNYIFFDGLVCTAWCQQFSLFLISLYICFIKWL